MAVYSERARKALLAAGARQADGVNLRLPRSMVEKAVASNPSSITLYSRDGKTDAVLEKNRVHYGTGGTAIYVLDAETNAHRQSTIRDVALCARFVEALKNIHVFTINVFPNEIPQKEDIDVNRFFHSLDNTHKHVMGGIYSMPGLKQVIQMAEMMAGGEKQLAEKPFVSFITLIISPYKIDEDYGDMTCYVAEKGLPIVVPTEPICGTTSPITLAGNILTHTAETLAGITLVQAVRRGAPGICGSVGSITNLRTMAHLGGAIERAMINAGCAQLAQHFEIPLYSTGGTSDAKRVDIQAAYESAMSSLLVAMSGANYIHDIAGLMESDLTVSYEKLVVDNEILGMCQRVLRGIEVSDETLGLEMILEKGPAKDYMLEPHTIAHMRDEFYVPEVTNREKRKPDTMTDTMQAVKARVLEIRNGKAPRIVSDDLRKKLSAAFENLNTELG